MRRALLVVAALAVPLGAAAQINAPPNTVIERDNFNTRPTPATSYLNLRQCAGTEPVRLEWNIPGANSGTYGVFSSSVDPATRTGADLNFCLETDETSADRFGGPVGTSFPVDAAVQQRDVSGKEISDEASPKSAGAQKLCDRDETDLWVCVHWTPAQGAKGSAVGKFRVQLSKPTSPTGVSAEPGPRRLQVRWAASAGNPDHYIATAVPVDASRVPIQGAPSIDSQEATATSVAITGLTNGQEYKVTVRAYSLGGNPSDYPDDPADDPPDGSNTAFGTPTDVDDFWDVYKNAGGQEKGGCGAGAAGPVALLAVAGLLGRLRRRP